MVNTLYVNKSSLSKKRGYQCLFVCSWQSKPEYEVLREEMGDLKENLKVKTERVIEMFDEFNYRIYSLIRRTEKICLLDENLLKTRGASYNRVFSRNEI